jgi:hypothetical protein
METNHSSLIHKGNCGEMKRRFWSMEETAGAAFRVPGAIPVRRRLSAILCAAGPLPHCTKEVKVYKKFIIKNA